MQHSNKEAAAQVGLVNKALAVSQTFLKIFLAPLAMAALEKVAAMIFDTMLLLI